MNNVTCINATDELGPLVIPGTAIAVFGFIINLVLFYIIATARQLKDPSYTLIANVIACDCLSSLALWILFLGPIFLRCQTLAVGHLFCKAILFSLYATYNISVFCLTAISIVRYKIITKTSPKIRHISRHRLSQQTTKKLGIIWILSWLYAVPSTFIVRNHADVVGYCDISYANGYEYLNLIYFLSMTLISYIIPLLIMIYYYARAVRRLADYVSPGNSRIRRKRDDHGRFGGVIKMLIIITAIFMLFTWPFFASIDLLAIKAKSYLELKQESIALFQFCLSAFSISSLVNVINPFLYIKLDKNIRRAVRQKFLLFSNCNTRSSIIVISPAQFPTSIYKKEAMSGCPVKK